MIANQYYKINILPHIIAALFALFYAFQISLSAFVKTGVQFVSPLLIIIAVHLIWLACTTGLRTGFSLTVYKQSAQTAIVMAVFIFASSIIAPMPATAGIGEVFGGLLATLFCVAILIAIIAMIAYLIYLVFKLIRGIARRVRGSDTTDTDTRLYDVASLGVGVILLIIASAEGVTDTFSFSTYNQATATRVINAQPSKVWQTMETATSPRFALPKILHNFPQPVGVVVDEGTQLGANRKVAFSGREGAGHLTLQVVERTDRLAVFEVQSDTSPFANWVAYRYLTYRVEPAKGGTRLSVTLDYDRQLAPAWAFTPMIKFAAYLAMDVLARDVKLRSEM